MATRIAGQDGHGLSRRTAQTGLLVAAFVVPGSFASSLTPRSWLDQGIVTGLDTTLNYLLTASTQDVVEAVAGGVAPLYLLGRGVLVLGDRRGGFRSGYNGTVRDWAPVLNRRWGGYGEGGGLFRRAHGP